MLQILQSPLQFLQWGGVGYRNREQESRREEALAILLGRSNQDIEIAREPRRAMKRERVRADDHELNAVRGQQRAELVEVWRKGQ